MTTPSIKMTPLALASALVLLIAAPVSAQTAAPRSAAAEPAAQPTQPDPHAGHAMHGQPAAGATLTQAQVKTAIEAKGYTNVNDIEFDDGMWEADATSADGNRVDLRFDAASGTVYPDTAVAELTENDIRARLAAAGYTEVRDVKFDDGLWKAEGRKGSEPRMELKLDGKTGAILAQERD